MFSVIFEVSPKAECWDAYLGYARMLRPELVRIDGFIDNVRYRSLRRAGWLLSLSDWRDEKSLIRWRTLALHHQVQEKGRAEVFLDYHLRVGQITADTHLPPGQVLREQRLDETEAGASKAVTIVEAKRLSQAALTDAPETIAARLGLTDDAGGLVEWDVFDAILTPGDALLLLSWRDARAAEADERSFASADTMRRRRVRIIRDYGMRDRREAPQYYPPVGSPVDAEGLDVDP